MSRASPRFKRVNPPLPLVGTTNGVVMYRLFGLIEAQVTISTFTYTATVPSPTNSQLTTLLTNISSALLSKIKAVVSSDWSVQQEQVAVIHRNDLPTVSSTANSGTTGARPSGHAPTIIALVIKRVSAVKGQHGRGRLSLPGLSLTDQSQSTWNITNLGTPLATLIGTTGMQLAVSDGTNSWLPCIAQRSTTPPKLAVGFSVLQQVTVDTLLGTIRRRKIGRGI